MSDSVHHGFMNGLKDEEKEKSFGQDEGIIKTMKCHHLRRRKWTEIVGNIGFCWVKRGLRQ